MVPDHDPWLITFQCVVRWRLKENQCKWFSCAILRLFKSNIIEGIHCMNAVIATWRSSWVLKIRAVNTGSLFRIVAAKKKPGKTITQNRHTHHIFTNTAQGGWITNTHRHHMSMNFFFACGKNTFFFHDSSTSQYSEKERDRPFFWGGAGGARSGCCCLINNCSLFRLLIISYQIISIILKYWLWL